MIRSVQRLSTFCFLQVYNALKTGILSTDWVEVRCLRNCLVHEAVEDSQELAEAIKIGL